MVALLPSSGAEAASDLSDIKDKAIRAFCTTGDSHGKLLSHLVYLGVAIIRLTID